MVNERVKILYVKALKVSKNDSTESGKTRDRLVGETESSIFNMLTLECL